MGLYAVTGLLIDAILAAAMEALSAVLNSLSSTLVSFGFGSFFCSLWAPFTGNSSLKSACPLPLSAMARYSKSFC